MRHQQGKHTNIVYKCKKCGFTSQWGKTLLTHERVVHKGHTYDCTRCTFKGKTSVQLMDHRQKIHENTVYHCDECSYESKVKRYVKHQTEPQKRCIQRGGKVSEHI